MLMPSTLQKSRQSALEGVLQRNVALKRRDWRGVAVARCNGCMSTETTSDDDQGAPALKRFNQKQMRRLESLRECAQKAREIGASAERQELRKALNAQLRMIIGVTGAYSVLLCVGAYLVARYWK